MRIAVSRPGRRARTAILVCGAAVLGACADRQGPTTPLTLPDIPDRATLLRCTANVAQATMECVGVPKAGAQASVSPGGPSKDERIVGNQGYYVRLTSSDLAYAGGIFSLNVTVQNLTNLAMATADGATRHANGLRVFLIQDPVGVGGTVSVANATGQAFFTAANQDYFQYGGSIGGTDQGELGADGVLASAEVSGAKQWQFNVPGGTTSFSFSVYVSSETPTGAMATVAPQVTSISPATLVPGATATLTGMNFSATPGNNTVRVGGVTATVTSASATQLQVTVPCVASGSVGVQVTQAAMTGVPVAAPLQVAQRTLNVGQSAVVANAADVGCNELPATGGDARYLVAVYNTSDDPDFTTGFQIAGDPAAAAAPAPVALRSGPRLSTQAGEPDRHGQLLEMNRQAGERLAARFRNDARMRPRMNVSRDPVEPPLTRTIRVANINSNSFCNSYYEVTATRVYYAGKLAIYEDDATPAALRASANAAMATYYQKIGDEFNADMEPVIRNNFGDPLARDASTDNNGVVVALFTPVINNNFNGVAGFVVSCDQYPNAAGNLSSNFGEVFYAYQPTDPGTGYNTFTPDSWYRSIRATFIHETKHVASYVARVVNGTGNWEAGWLEEGTARHSEELWARNAIYNVAWKGNTGYGSAAAPNSIYCDVRPTSSACAASNPRRPSLNMQRHFSALYTFLGYPNLLSPFGPTPYDGSFYYATSWSLNRYAIDRYAASDAAFLTALTQSNLVGTANFNARTGVPLAEVMGGWALSLFMDDYAGVAVDPSMQMPTWDFTNIYAGLKADFPSTYTRARRIEPTQVALGSFAPLAASELYGGGVIYLELSGTHTQAQLINLTGTGGGALNGNLRVAIARIQ
ncbi:IPT/TIG domain-containing protein [Longimicrobium sp.]|uniref:IPT/TIG domain-containing protein n=1 Tax=Longimicrobium sp. TaxID=2029185 RepID=UPI003B3B1422